MSKVFVPRTVPPQIGEKWWSTQYNKCLAITNGTVLPNCVGYAYGRFAEILGYFHPDLPMCNAGIWLDELKKKNTSLKWGTVPKLGAVVVWKEPGAYGHVGIVEYIYEDGTLMLSESGYGSGWNKRFWNSGPRTSPNWYGEPYQFQGFIYNPGTEDVTNVAPYSGGVKYGTDVSSITTSYSDQVAAFEKSVSANPSAGSTTNTGGSGTSRSTGGSTASTSTPSQSTPSQSTSSQTSELVVSHSSTDASAQKFINAISSHTGENNDGFDWVLSKTGFNASGWSAAMLCAASIEANQSDIVPTSIFAYSEFTSKIVEQMHGTFIPGSKQGGVEKPKIGDIFAIGGVSKKSKYVASTLGIITEVRTDNIQVLEGDCGKKILAKTHRLADISYYVRPNWNRIAFEPVLPTYDLESVSASRAEVAPVKGPPMVDYLHDQTKNDATLREVTYLTEQAKPSISTTGTKLSAINYSGLLGKVYDVMGLANIQYPDSENMRSYNFNGTYFQSSATDLQGVPQIIFEFLYNKGLSVAKVTGFLANIQAESSFKTNAVNNSSGAYGICQWTGTRKENMIKYCGSDWKNNLTGQLEFMWSELQSSEQRTLTALLAVEGDSQSAAEQAAEIICREYERPSNVEEAVKLRKNLTQKLWDNLSATYTSGVVSSDSFSDSYSPSDVITNISGRGYEKGTTIEIPSHLLTNRTSAALINFKKRSIRWPPNTNPYYAYEQWEKRNSKSKYYICCVDNYFLVSLSTRFGEDGDIVSIVFDNGTYLDAVIAEALGTSFYVNDKSSDIVQWMTVGDDVSSLELGLKQAGWLDRKIVKIVNYGTWFA